MGTSLAPSPIESVIQGPLALASPTTSAFYLGETRQQTTEEASKPKRKNL